MSRARDTQRSKLYAAERAAGCFDKDLGERPTLERAQAYINTVTRSPWTVRKFGTFRIEARPGKGSASAHGSRVILLGIPSRTRQIILHEIAHCIAYRRHPGVASHGREFAALYLELVQHFLGVDRAKQLRAEFRARRVRVGPKRATAGNAGNMAGLVKWREQQAARAAAATVQRADAERIVERALLSLSQFNPFAEMAIARGNQA